jgi:hypothetical protein
MKKVKEKQLSEFAQPTVICKFKNVREGRKKFNQLGSFLLEILRKQEIIE